MLQIFTRVGRWLGLVTPRIDFTVSPAALTAPIVPDAGLVVYTVDDNGFSVAETITSNAVRNRLCQDTFRIGRNVSGETIDKGAAVYIYSAVNQRTNYDLARSDSLTTMPCIGLTTLSAIHNAYCQIMIVGVLRDIKTDYAGWADGTRLYVDPTTAGALTHVKPTHPNFSQWVGTVEYSHANQGRILVAMQDLNGIEDGTNQNTFTIGDGAAGTKTLTFDGTADRSISWDATNLSLGTGHVIVEGVTSTGATGTGKMVFDTSPTLVTPLLGTPTSGNLANCTFPTLNQDTTGTASKVLTATKSDNVNYYPTFVAANDSSSQGIDVGAMTYNALTGLLTALALKGNLTTAIIKPASDATTAIEVTKANGSTSIIDVDTTNSRVGIGNTAPTTALDVTGTVTATAFSGVALSQCSDYVAPTAWTPVLTFTTPGDLNVVYSQQYGTYCKRGPLVTVTFAIVTTTFTYTTASGAARVTGLPYTSDATTGRTAWGVCRSVNIYYPTACTQLATRVSAGVSYISFVGSGTNPAAGAVLDTYSLGTGTNITISGSVEYWV